MIDLLRKLTAAYGVSGTENEISNIISSLISPWVDEIRKDKLGNLICIKRIKPLLNSGSDGSSTKIMFASHMDSIGIISTFADENGFIRFSNVGWVSQYFALGQRVKFENGVSGVIFYEQEIENMKELKLSKMFIDVGAKSRDEALKMVPVGTTGIITSDFLVQKDAVISNYLDNRAGCAVLIETARLISENAGNINEEREIYYVFTVQEELGLRGAGPAAFGLSPDYAIAVDVTDTGDIPGCPPMEVKMGAGPAIKIKDKSIICHPYIKERLKAVCEVNSFPYQLEIMEDGGTDAGAIHMSAGGIVTGGLSIPTRYIHSPQEMCSINDLQNAALILSKF